VLLITNKHFIPSFGMPFFLSFETRCFFCFLFMKPFTESDYFMYGSSVAHRASADTILIRLLGSISFLNGCGRDLVL